MSNQESLKVVGVEVPKGASCMGTKVKLSNGQYLAGVQSISLHADTDTQRWSLSLKLCPEFIDPQTIEAVLTNVKLVKREQAEQRQEAIRKQIELLEAEHASWMGIIYETTTTSTETTGS